MMIVNWDKQFLRTFLFAPGNHPRKVAKVGNFGADAIVLDLEDAVALTEKEDARSAVRVALPTYKDVVVIVRVNGLKTGLCLADLDTVVCPQLHAIMLPKVEDSEALHEIDEHLTALEKREGINSGTIRLLPIIETARGILKVGEIALGAPPRVHTLFFGPGDFTTDLRIDLTKDATEILYARSRVVVASRAARMPSPIDGPYLDLRDQEGLVKDSFRARQLGFQGRAVIYPPQVKPVNWAFSTVPEEDVVLARKFIEAFEKAEASGSASIQVEGKFVDYPIYQRARHKIRLYEASQVNDYGGEGTLNSEIQPSPSDGSSETMPLEGLKVLDVSTLFAGPVIATIMADFGADVIKVEHPRGDALRSLGWHKDGISLWWALTGRGKRCITLNLSKQTANKIFKELVAETDILIENFRPGTMERWGLGYEELCAVNPGLIMVRTTGFGQTGPYRNRPGFGTLAESMSGFAHINGHPDGPPTLPPFALGDGVAALFGTFSAMFAIYYRDVKGTGEGQYIDLSIYEPLFWLLGPQAIVYDQLGIVQGRTGNRTPFAAPRNAYRAKDGRWLGLSASTQSIAERVMRLVGREDLIQEPWFKNHIGRLEHQGELDEIIGEWIGNLSTDEVLKAFEEAEAAIAPIYNIADIFTDPQYQSRETITTIQDPKLGAVRMQNVIPRMSKTPGRVRHLGMELGAHNHEIYIEQLGYQESDLENWRKEGVI